MCLRGAFFQALFIFMLFLFFPLAVKSYAGEKEDIDAQISAEEQRRKSLSRQIETYRSRIKDMDVKVDNLIGRIDNLQQNEAIARQETEVLELHNRKLRADLDFLIGEMQITESQADALIQQLKNRMIDMYKYGESEGLNLFFSSENAFQAVESIYLLKKLDSYDKFILEQLKAKQQDMTLSKKILDEHRARLKRQTEELSEQRKKYNSAIVQTNSFINDVRRQKALAIKAAREIEEAQKAVGQTILNLIAIKKAKEAEAQKRGAPKKAEVNYLPGVGRGSLFDWPVRGPITSGFGTRIHPIFKTKSFHSGIDISAPSGTPVKAAAAGEILFEGWLRGYGQVIIIDHGRNFSTVYAHLSSINVKENQVVRAGAVIGGVGRTGTATGYHLHFEVRIGSAVKNPLDYLKK